MNFTVPNLPEISLDKLPSLMNIRNTLQVLAWLSCCAAIGFAINSGHILSQTKREISALEDHVIPIAKIDNAHKSKKALRDFEIINTRNLFATFANNTKTTKTAPPITKLKLRLVGTSAGPRGNKFAIVEDTAKRKEDVFDIGETMFSQAKLEEVFPDSIRISYNGKIETLLLEEGSSSSSTGNTSSSSNGTDFTIAEEELNEALGNLPRLLSQARAVPYFKNGKSVGMRLFAIRRGSLYEKLGLKNGDIIKEVNDNNLSDPSQALKIFEQLKNERSIDVLLERGGKETSQHYQIR